MIDFKYKKKYIAENGKDGAGANCSGKSGKDLYIKVPTGTLLIDEKTGCVIADLAEQAQTFVVLKGGRRQGNSNFATATRQVPNFARPGEKGREITLVLELKLLADVGLIGLPNVGKSTLLSIISAARPKIANYHFTTIIPNLGVVRLKEGLSFVVADIPGLIEGAHEGTGLGHDFLRHIERTKMLVHLVDVSGSEGRNPVEDFHVINKELELYSIKLSKKRQIVVANKSDICSREQIEEFKTNMAEAGYDVYVISAATREGIKELLFGIANILPGIESDYEAFENFDYKEHDEEDNSKYSIKREEQIYIIEGPWIDKFMLSVNIDNHDSLMYFQRVLRKKGIIDELEKMGIEENDTVRINDFEFNYIP